MFPGSQSIHTLPVSAAFSHSTAAYIHIRRSNRMSSPSPPSFRLLDRNRIVHSQVERPLRFDGQAEHAHKHARDQKREDNFTSRSIYRVIGSHAAMYNLEAKMLNTTREEYTSYEFDALWGIRRSLSETPLDRRNLYRHKEEIALQLYTFRA